VNEAEGWWIEREREKGRWRKKRDGKNKKEID